jgi:hypothetical protein
MQCLLRKNKKRPKKRTSLLKRQWIHKNVAVAGACFLIWVLSLLVGPKVAGKAGAAVIPLSAVYPFAGFGSPDRRTTCDKFAGTYVLNAGTYHNALQGKASNV